MDWQRIIENIIPSIIVLFGTLGAVIITNRFSLKKLMIENTEKEEKEEKNLFFSRIETLYRKFQNYSFMIRDYHAIFIKLIHKKISPEDFKKGIMVNMEKRRAESLEVETLINLYHHEFLGHWNQYIELIDETPNIIMNNLENLNEQVIQDFYRQ